MPAPVLRVEHGGRCRAAVAVGHSTTTSPASPLFQVPSASQRRGLKITWGGGGSPVHLGAVGPAGSRLSLRGVGKLLSSPQTLPPHHLQGRCAMPLVPAPGPSGGGYPEAGGRCVAGAMGAHCFHGGGGKPLGACGVSEPTPAGGCQRPCPETSRPFLSAVPV